VTQLPVVVGVRFKKAGKIYYFDPANLELTRGSKVIVETARGLEYGEVSIAPREITDEDIVQPLKPVVRIGTERDAEVAAENKRREKEAFVIAQERISNHGLDMNLVDVEYTFDNAKIVFYFTAEGRVDFRELVKDLASIFRTRIEMRKIGVRDEAKLIGGIGPCGRILCCTSFLGDFAPVSIRMAKDQNLSLNPSKISGLCGRLMCCLRYEQDTYEAAKKDPTLAPGYAPPQLTEELVGSIADIEDERPSRPSGGKMARISGQPDPLPGRSPRPDRPRWEERNHGEDRPQGRSERSERPERSERSERPERPERGEGRGEQRGNRGERFEARPDRGERSESRGDRGAARPERPAHRAEHRPERPPEHRAEPPTDKPDGAQGRPRREGKGRFNVAPVSVPGFREPRPQGEGFRGPRELPPRAGEAPDGAADAGKRRRRRRRGGGAAQGGADQGQPRVMGFGLPGQPGEGRPARPPVPREGGAPPAEVRGDGARRRRRRRRRGPGGPGADGGSAND
jgi:cell fate regulator YaaT (PSP1 superfamily)